jgi:hypothetical protein
MGIVDRDLKLALSYVENEVQMNLMQLCVSSEEPRIIS